MSGICWFAGSQNEAAVPCRGVEVEAQRGEAHREGRPVDNGQGAHTAHLNIKIHVASESGWD